jgi:hypothetical protein
VKYLAFVGALLEWVLAALPSQAQIAFGPPATYVVGSQPEASALGDFDGDGDLDLAVTSDLGDKVTIFTNGGGGVSLAQVVRLGIGTGPRSIAAADLDQDGDLDLAVTLHNVAAVTVLLNSSGAFTATNVLLSVGLEPRSLIAVDLDADGDRDLVTSNRDANTVSILKNDGNATFQPAVTLPVGAAPLGLTSADFDGDGDFDLAVANGNSYNLAVLLNDGTGTFNTPTFVNLGGFHAYGIVAADLDADGDVDLAASAENDSLQKVVCIVLNDGSATFTGPVNHPAGGSGSGVVLASDVDLDGDLDLVTANQSTNDVSVFPNMGAGAFGAPQLFPVGPGPEHVIAGDLTGDGAPDLVAANSAGTTVSTRVNQTPTGSISFMTPPAIGTLAAIELSYPQDAGDFFVCGFSFSTVPGFDLPDGRHVALNPDALFTVSLTPNNGVFFNNAGWLNAWGSAPLLIAIPALTQLIGQSMFMVCVILNSGAPLGLEQVSAPFQITFQ